MQGRSYWAHSANSAGDWHPLSDHLQSVGRMAREFAARAPWCDEAGLAGMAHDIGKYGEDFQRRLRGEVSGLDPLVDGAWLALMRHRAVAAALATEGHHVGLQRSNHTSLVGLQPSKLTVQQPLGLTHSEPDLDRLLASTYTALIVAKCPSGCVPRENPAFRRISLSADAANVFPTL